eukprot:CAMPEP_0172927556 /NCGR_PEP_ID=MMETSP1075-20121228/217523_1 /TAXON_ID=2916 /ORGANISM="Ceratium fusus, Strain PA161109" /LENGTH=443 /DNA_ID=CAMNT_0013788815 /DNA_START=38 /DNA_END=1371 /DNA_ORIENTATION=-
MTRSRGDALVVHMVALAASIALLGAPSFVPARIVGAFRSGVLRGVPRSGAAGGHKPTQSREGGGVTAMLGFATAAGVAVGVLSKRRTAKTVRQYTTDQILPKMEWLSAGFGEGDLEPGEIRTVTLAGLDVAVGKTEDGKVFAGLKGFRCVFGGFAVASMTRFQGDAFIRMAFLMVSMVFLGVLSFVPAQTSGVLRGAPHTGAAGGQKHTQSQEGDSMMPMLGFATAGGVAFGVLTRRQTSKTRRRYTTDQILPKMEWLSAGFGDSDLEPGEIRTVTLAGLDVAVGKTEDGKVFAVAKDGVVSAGFGDSDLEPGEIRTVTLAGLDVAVGKTEGGKVFAVGDKAPPTGISLSQGGYVEGNNVVEPQYGSKFDAFTGDVTEWCTFPPLLGAAIGAFMGGPTMIAVFNCRGGGNIQVEVDTNARKAYEADYWKGLLDAQGKNDGTYY